MIPERNRPFAEFERERNLRCTARRNEMAIQFQLQVRVSESDRWNFAYHLCHVQTRLLIGLPVGGVNVFVSN